MVISWVNVRDCNAWVVLLASVVQQRKQAARPGWHNWEVVVISPKLAVFLYRHGLGPLGPTHVLLLLLRQYEQLCYVTGTARSQGCHHSLVARLRPQLGVLTH